MQVGFTCVWDNDREATWSHIPANLLRAFERLTDVQDVEAEPGRLVKRLHHRQNRRAGQPEWTPRGWNDLWRTVAVAAATRKRRPDVLLQINELTTSSVPYWVYRDMTWAQVANFGGDTATGRIDERLVARALRHERRVYSRSRGVFTFSDWAARNVRTVFGAPAMVVPPGINVPVVQRRTRARRESLLFLGRAFERKGGPQVVAAFAALRRSRPELRLDVAGPDRWPPGLPMPEGVRFHGPVAPARAAELFEAADLFVMPSVFEAYGIVLLEALSAGVPCVVRDACAMPEIVEHGRLGVVSPSLDTADLAAAIARGLDDDALQARVAEATGRIRAFYTWDRAARQMLDAMASDLTAMTPR